MARGPLRATVFFLMETMVASGMEETPLMITGVTETSSH